MQWAPIFFPTSFSGMFESSNMTKRGWKCGVGFYICIIPISLSSPKQHMSCFDLVTIGFPSLESLDKSPAHLHWPGQHPCSRLAECYSAWTMQWLVKLSLWDWASSSLMLALNTHHVVLRSGRNLWFRRGISHSDLTFCLFVLFFCLVFSFSSTPPAWEPNTSPPTNLVQMLAVCIKMKKQKQKKIKNKKQNPHVQSD